MTDAEMAERLEAFAREVERLPGVSRNRPHAFAEAKSELAGDMRRLSSELRTSFRPRAALPQMRPGTIVIPPTMAHPRERRVHVEVRRARA